ncbi:MAG: hypothetical protein JXA30_16185 [Deltaproteobacteria bacterium]|nr:hypothetical protein [Deltaproteobacteria bacterium]
MVRITALENKLVSAFVFAIFMLGLLVWPVRASVIMRFELEQLVARSDVIVVATTLGWKSRWGARKRILTDVTLRVDESIKGKYQPSDVLVVTRLGGEIDGLGMRVAGEAAFYKDKKALVFLREIPASGELRVVGMSQGVYHFNEAQGQIVVAPDESDSALVERDSDGKLQSALSTRTEPSPANDVLEEVRRLVLKSHDK